MKSFRVLISTSRLRDSFNLESHKGTNEVDHNTYNTKELVLKNPLGIRIDHIFYATSDGYNVSSN